MTSLQGIVKMLRICRKMFLVYFRLTFFIHTASETDFLSILLVS